MSESDVCILATNQLWLGSVVMREAQLLEEV